MLSLDASQIALIEVAVAALQTALLVAAGVVAWRQWREAQQARYLGAILRVFDEVDSREAYQDADATLGLPQSIQDFTPEERELATWTTRVYEKLAFLVESGMIPAKYIVPIDSRRIIWTWDALQPYIQEQRRLRDSGGAYRISGDGRYFELLAQRALRFRKQTFGASERVHPPIPEDYRATVRARIARGERISAGGLPR